MGAAAGRASRHTVHRSRRFPDLGSPEERALMTGKGAPISPEQARQILEGLRGRKGLAALKRELSRRGTPVSAFTLIRRWKANQWSLKRTTGKPVWGREAVKTIERSGLSADAITALEACLKSASDAELGASNMRSLLINSKILMVHAGASFPELIQADARGLAVLYAVAAQMARAGVDLMEQTRELADRAMRQRLAERSVSHR
jgi:hypothetical protein